ncbi:protein O-mannosyl-transferase TMTC4-like isoform X1 [Rhopilema esculentum]|uniref:protein O-mannosyl-transferase TMTC4-like isoform X1 n=1 Tax=Rhopilema esculentum TaxID=499914 RepID=UPI0031D4F0F0
MQRVKKKSSSTQDVGSEFKYSSNVTVLKCKNIPVPDLTQTTASAVVASFAVFCFLWSVNGDFVFDDNEAILNNRDVRLETSFFSIFKHDFWGDNITSSSSHKSYRPITVWTFRISYWAAGGYNPLGFHIVNITLHAINCVLALRVFSVIFGGISVSREGFKLFTSPESSFLAALIFTVHPIHTENVAGIVGRADLLCTFFFFLSFLCFTRTFSTASRQTASALPEKLCPGSLCACVIFAALSLFSKEQGITVLGLCLVFDILQVTATKRKSLVQITKTGNVAEEDHLWLKTFAKRVSVIIITVLIFMTWRFRVMGANPPKFQHGDNPSAFQSNVLARVINYNYIYCLNVWLLLNPFWLCFDWAMGCVPPITSSTDHRILAPILLWLIILAVLWKCWMLIDCHVARTLLMLMAFSIVPFLPSTNIFFTVGFVIAERNLYISSFGFCGLVALGIVVISEYGNFHKVIRVCICLLVAVSTLRCLQRSQDWLSEEKLFRSAENVCPLNAKVHYNIGHVLSKKGETESAIKYYRESIRLNPLYDQPLNNLGNLLQELGHPLEAEKLLSKAVNISRSFAAGWMNLGVTKAHLKKYKEAEECYANAISLRKYYPDAHYNLGNLYLEIKNFKKAVAAYRKVIEMKPDHASSWINLILLYDELGQSNISLQLGKKVLALMPRSPGLMYTLANVYGKAEKFEDAEKLYLQAIELDPNQAAYFGNLAVLYHRWQRFKNAEEFYLRSLQIDPHNPTTIKNYKKLQKTLSHKR